MNGLIAEVHQENTDHGKKSYIVPSMLPYSDESAVLAAIRNISEIQTSKTLCFNNTHITRPVFHGVLAMCIHQFKIARVSPFGVLDRPGCKALSKNFGYFVLNPNWADNWYFIVAYKLSFIRVTLFRKKSGDCEQYCPEGIGNSLSDFLKNSIYDMLRYQNRVGNLNVYIDTNVFGDDTTEPRDIIELRKELLNDSCPSGITKHYSERDLLTWFPKMKVRNIYMYLTQ